MNCLSEPHPEPVDLGSSHENPGLDIDQGEPTLAHMVIDSRAFDAEYLPGLGSGKQVLF